MAHGPIGHSVISYGFIGLVHVSYYIGLGHGLIFHGQNSGSFSVSLRTWIGSSVMRSSKDSRLITGTLSLITSGNREGLRGTYILSAGLYISQK